MNKGTEIKVMDVGKLRSDPEELHQLSQLYCNIFSLDPFFGEYRQCPVCGAYYNQHQVEVGNIHTCDKNHSVTELIPAWDVENVKLEILDQASEPGFFGVIALQESEVVGFAWARLISFEEIKNHWGDTLVAKVQPIAKTGNVYYFDELGVNPEARSKGVGRILADAVCSWGKKTHPEDLSLLRTHSKSNARKIFGSLGYVVFSEDTEYGAGRVMLKIDRCEELNVV